MTEFKAGDRVKVEFEAVAQEADVRGGYYVQANNGRRVWLPGEYLTKLHNPLPTKRGAVIRVTGIDGQRIFERATVSWYETGQSRNLELDYMRSLVEVCDFTVLYAGDDE